MARRKKKKDVTWHAHGCINCHGRYTDACSKPDHDDECEMCRWDRARGFDYGQWDPRPCCVEKARECSEDEEDRYALRGYGPWYLCPVCIRTHPHVHPRKRKTYTCEYCDRTEKHVHRESELTQ